MTAPPAMITMSAGGSLVRFTCGFLSRSADRAGMALALHHHRADREGNSPEHLEPESDPLVLEVGNQPADGHEAGEDSQDEGYLLPREPGEGVGQLNIAELRERDLGGHD